MRSLGTWEWRGRKETNPEDSVLLSIDPTSKADPTGQPAPGKGTLGCWELGAEAYAETLVHGGGRSRVLADTPALGQELHQTADGRGDQMVFQLEPPHIGAPAALVL